MKKYPLWTVVYNIVSPENNKWIGKGWEFFDTESAARACYNRHISMGNCPTKRSFYKSSDEQHLGACHTFSNKLTNGNIKRPIEIFRTV